MSRKRAKEWRFLCNQGIPTEAEVVYQVIYPHSHEQQTVGPPAHRLGSGGDQVASLADGPDSCEGHELVSLRVIRGS